MTRTGAAAIRAATTWQALVDERPELEDALYVAEHFQRRSPGFCANRVFYRVLKPIVLRAVGWSAEVNCPPGEHWRTAAELVARKPLVHTNACRAEWKRQEWLKTSEAYDCAYETIYEALPDCQHGTGPC